MASGHLRLGTRLTTVATVVRLTSSQVVHRKRHNGISEQSKPHTHGFVERHHHDLDERSAVVLEGAVHNIDSGSQGAAGLMPAIATPSEGRLLIVSAVQNGSWPARGAVIFDSSIVLPLLRPPSV